MEWIIETKNLVFSEVKIEASSEEEAQELFERGEFTDVTVLDETWPEVLAIYPGKVEDEDDSTSTDSE